MDNLLGKKIWISGMTIEIIADEGESWKCLNITTRETVSMKKTVINDALRFGRAELVS